ncbi:MAG: hypothetical protein R2939_08450 [Kofleriaceae bacterium]
MFLYISLKAGGVGLSLTRADTVITTTRGGTGRRGRATDRAHRLGQDNPVMVYKLVARGTVEAIVKMQDDKRGSPTLPCATAASPGWDVRSRPRSTGAWCEPPAR